MRHIFATPDAWAFGEGDRAGDLRKRRSRFGRGLWMARRVHSAGCMHLRKWLGLVTSTFVLTVSAAAYAEPPKSPPKEGTRVLVSGRFSTSPFIFNPYGDEYEQPDHPLLLGGRGEILYRFGFFRIGADLLYVGMLSQERDGPYACFHELAVLPVLSFAHTFGGGTEIALNLSAGPAINWRRGADPTRINDWSPWKERIAPATEVLATVAVPVAPDLDLSFAAGLSWLFRSRPELEPDYMSHLLEAGVRKRW